MIDLELCRNLSSVQIGLMNHPVLTSELLKLEGLDHPVLRTNLLDRQRDQYSLWGRSIFERYVMLRPEVRDWLIHNDIAASLRGERIERTQLSQDELEVNRTSEEIVSIRFQTIDAATAFKLRWL